MEIITQSVIIPDGTPGLNGYFAYPTSGESLPALVIIHEAYGLNDDLREITRRFANEGYAVLAVDLFAGRNRMMCMFRFFTESLRNSFDHSGIQDLKTSLTFLQDQPMVDKTRVGAVGFCLGGGFAIAWACSDQRLKVIAPFYALAPRPITTVERTCPVVGSWPEKDFSTGAGHKVEAVLRQNNIPHDIKFYPGATHSFFNGRRDGRPENRAAADDAWERMMDFFRERL
jgi:carboxymethylenebutenolidase